MSDKAGSDIAIIGMAGRFPGARNLAEYWANLRKGAEAVRFLTDEQLLAVGELPENIADPGYVKACSFLDDVESFDARFFGFSPRDAAITDPQHRMFFELAWQAFEDAGYDPEKIPGAVGVFATCGMNAYMMFHLAQNREIMNTVGEWLVRHTGNDMNFLATRVSYELNLTGPSLNVQTACSSALTALHLAVQSLLNFECDVALAGGSAISLPHDRGYTHKQGEILSPDGHCRPFDARSQGTVFGSGAGAVILKRLSDAVADGDNVLAVIKGSAINNDGSDKVGYLAPSVSGQAKVVAEALAIADTPAESISYIEAHGTGTLIGDPIEVTALTQAYRAKTAKNQFCWLGSVKSNIGHLGEAAGMAGLIKTVLALQHREIPPTINYSSPNPQIDFATSPFKIVDRLTPWVASPRRAGVTALGAGGTNAHVIVEEAPLREPGDSSRPEQLVLLSGKTATALDTASERLATHLRTRSDQPLADVAFTLREGRRGFEHRRVVVGRTHADIADALSSKDGKRVATHVAGKPSVVFMFPGGGAQYIGMGRELYEREPVYRAAIDLSLRAMTPELAARVRGALSSGGEPAQAPSLALPALFAVEYALAQLFISWGLRPSAFIGHSAGEYVAAALAGVMSHADALALVTLRGRLFETLPKGGMLAISLSESEAQKLLPPTLSFAAINGPQSVVASGPVEAIDELERTLTARDIDCSRVHIDVAAHSAMLTPILAEFERFCRTIRFEAPKIPIASNLTGEWLRDVDASYWVKHLREPVRFAEGLKRLDGQRVLIEIGPGRTLASLAQKQTSFAALTSMRHPKEEASDVAFALHTLGRAWAAGAPVDWDAFQGDELRLRVPLPTYPFERERFWIERGTAAASAGPIVLRKSKDLGEWFWASTWQTSVLPKAEPMPDGWVVFTDTAGLVEALAKRLGSNRLVVVRPGAAFKRISENEFIVRADRRADYEALFDTLAGSGVHRVLHAWAVTKARTPERQRLDVLDDTHARTYASLVCVAQALGHREEVWDLAVVSNHLQRVNDEAVSPEKAALLGPVRVIPREMPNLSTRSIDVVWPAAANTLDLLASELLQSTPSAEATVVAHRRGQRFVRSETRTPLPAATTRWVKADGVYLITGGLGGIGLAIAEHLARAAKVKLVLVGRNGLPEQRQQWLDTHAPDDPTSRRIRQVEAIEQLGAEVLVASADVADLSSMRAAVLQAQKRFGSITGVLHAAGSLHDELIELRQVDARSPVLDSKIKGALVLDALLHKQPLDFFVLFSSVSAILGLPGQVDYTAANASLDAFADAIAHRQRAISINWSAWQEIGMAASMHATAWTARPPQDLGHAWLEQRDDRGDSSVFSTPFNRAKQWLLGEHVVRGGEAVVPGTGHLELIRAAWATRTGVSAVELANVFFLKAFVVAPDATRTLHIELLGDEVTVYSDDKQAPHVTAEARALTAAPPAALDLAAVQARCATSVTQVNGHLDQPFVEFGPRWANVGTIRTGHGEALIELRLPDAYVGDLPHFALHPALLDMATGGAQTLIPGFDQGKDFYVPFSYERLRLFAPLRVHFFSHVRLRQSAADLAVFDVQLVADDGAILADISGFTMKRASTAWLAPPETPPVRESTSLRELVLREGISPTEGLQALDRILSSTVPPQIAASSVDLHAWKQKVSQQARPSTNDEGTPMQFSRPQLSTAFAEPENAVERELAEMWKTLLGVAQVGRHDNFFDLGGESLIAVRLFNKVRTKFRIDFPLSTLFDAPTIAECAALIVAELGSNAAEAPAASQPVQRARWSSLIKMQPKGERTPFFCVAGMGGTTSNLRYLAALVGDNRPFYGLEPPGLDGVEERLYSVEALAEHYLREIVKVQPHGPYFLGGYSGGGVSAFEMARQLVARGEEVGFLGFIDSFSPSLPRKSYGDRALIHLQRTKDQGISYVTDTVGRRLWYQRFAMMRRVNRALGVVAPQRFRYDNIGDSWLTAEASYKPGEYAGRAILFRAREESALSLWTAFDVDEQHGWGRYVTGGVEVVVTPGDHTTMCEEPNVRTLASAMRERMAQAEEKKS